MYTVDDFKRDIEVYHAEVAFSFGSGNYIISECFGTGSNGERLFYSGPINNGYAFNADGVLDNLLVGGLPMRARINDIEPD